MQVFNHIPPPPNRNWKANLDKMLINQSALISTRYYNSVKAAISQHFHKGLQKAFTTQKEADGFLGCGGLDKMQELRIRNQDTGGKDAMGRYKS